MPAILPLLDFISEGQIGVEIGCQAGESSEKILERGVMRLWVVDPYKKYDGYLEGGSTDFVAWKNQAVNRLSKWVTEGKCVFMEMTSMEASLRFRQGQLDFVFIDGNHAFEYVLSDCIAWWDKVKEGGLFCGHDYSFLKPPTHDVRRAVDMWAERNGVSVSPIGECWMVRK